MISRTAIWSIVGAIVAAWLGLLAIGGAYTVWAGSRIATDVLRIVDSPKEATFADAFSIVRSGRRVATVGHFVTACAGPFRLVPILGHRVTQVFRMAALADAAADAGYRSMALLAAAQPSLAPDMKLEEYIKMRSDTRLPDPQLVASWLDSASNTLVELDAARPVIQELVRDPVTAKFVKPERLNAIATIAKASDLVIPLARTALDSWGPDLLKAYPFLSGYERPSEFLFVIQNNNELRATGGFFGTYGQLIVDKGRVGVFKTDNIYSLDYPAKEKITRQPPAPITKYILQDKWFMRDGNWYPNWPTSAKLLSEMYRDETGLDSQFTGVVGLNPRIIQSILELTGPLALDGKTYTADTLLDVLEEQVGKDYKASGLNIFNRKEIINKLKDQLVQKVLQLPADKMLLLPGMISSAIQERSVVAYSSEPSVQRLIDAFGVSGELVKTDSDYLLVTDSNLGSLKSDPALRRAVTVVRDPQNPLRRVVTVRYDHLGGFNWKTTRYRTWMRVYVPNGSTLVSVSGLMDMDRSAKKGVPETYVEDGKTVFAGFTSVEPKTGKTVVWTYDIPTDVKGNKTYIQTQPGVARNYDWTAAQGRQRRVDIRSDFTITW